MTRRNSARLAADARNRALRSFLQGLAIDLAVAVAALALTLTSSTDAWQGWAAVGISLVRTVVQAAASYVMRRFVDPSRVPTPLPPDPPGQPDAGLTVVALVVLVLGLLTAIAGFLALGTPGHQLADALLLALGIGLVAFAADLR